ncbi:hypothetical protein EJB05_51372, partial [Eragrostis curvula]
MFTLYVLDLDLKTVFILDPNNIQPGIDKEKQMKMYTLYIMQIASTFRLAMREKYPGFLEDWNIGASCFADLKVQSQIKTKAPRWIAPPSDFMKINVDGAVARAGHSDAVGVVCRNSQGVFIAASARVFDGISDPTTLEALACNEALSLALDCNLSKYLIATDCVEVVRGLEEKSLCSYSAIFREINLRRNFAGDVQFKHERRDSNEDAHKLAKAVCSFAPGRYVWFLQPPEFVYVPLKILDNE